MYCWLSLENWFMESLVDKETATNDNDTRVGLKTGNSLPSLRGFVGRRSREEISGYRW
jgi:hypothetical protein